MPEIKQVRYQSKGNDSDFKVEWKSDIHMLSVNGEDQEDLTVKIWAKLDNPFLSYGFLKF